MFVDPLELGKTDLTATLDILVIILYYLLSRISTLKYINSAILLMSKVNISRIIFHEWQWNREICKNFALKQNQLYGTSFENV